MCEHVVARPPASVGPAWPLVTATVARRAAMPVRVLAADRPGALQLFPITIPPEALLLPRHGPAPWHKPPAEFRQDSRCRTKPFLLAGDFYDWS